MNATDRLRALLDERGVEWRERQWGAKHSVTTFWHARGVRWHYRENRFGELRLHADRLTPEQAVEATLGREDCWNTWDSELTGRLRFQCSECKAVSLEITPFYCPVCGRKVVK